MHEFCIEFSAYKIHSVKILTDSLRSEISAREQHMEEKNTPRDFMYKYKKIAEKAPKRRFHGVFADSLIIVRGALDSALQLWEISGTPAPERGCRAPRRLDVSQQSQRLRRRLDELEHRGKRLKNTKKKYSEKPVFFNVLGDSSGVFFRYFSTIIG